MPLLKFLVIFVAMLSLVAVAYRFRELSFPLTAFDNIFPLTVSERADEKRCDLPLAYSVGSIDARFKLTENDVVAVLRDAEALWESGVGKDVFVLRETGGVPVHLVYDDRQARTDILEATLDRIDTSEGKYAAAKREYDSASAALSRKQSTYQSAVSTWEKDRDSYEKSVTDFNDRVRAYEQSVAGWNASGGGTEEDFRALDKERSELEKKQKKLEEKKSALNRSLEDLKQDQAAINARIAELNRLAEIVNRYAGDINQNVETYNGNANSEPFITGLYSENGRSASIDVYQFADTNELARILAHELGHALGLAHTPVDESVMYERVSKNDALSEADQVLFFERCGE